ncbi:MAG: sigma-70 family RNA polymerase sigma factor [Planctomycetota bacterium]
MSRAIEHELLRHATALRGLARVLVGERNADDLLQEVALEAIRRPPLRPGPARAWLAAIARHLAGKQRRAARRRASGEAQAPEPVPDWTPDRLAEHRESIDRLHAAFRSLPEPCRGTLQLRFFEGLSPPAIAAATGVPLDTIKSRQKRGLQLLRERLERDGDDWRAGLAAAFRLRPSTTAAPGAAGTGVVIMASAGKVFGFVGAALLAVSTAWWFAAREPNAPGGAVRTAARDAPVAPSTARDAPAQRVHAAAPASHREQIDELRLAEAVIRGRCVDARGRPLAGCRVALAGECDPGLALEDWARHNYDPQWGDPPPVPTHDDGRFELRFVPHEPLRFEVSMQRPGCVSMHASWPARTVGDGISPGAAIDLGDVALLPGMQARGRVLDDAGAPVIGAQVSLVAAESSEVDATPRAIGSDAPKTDANGEFAAVPLLPGAYLVGVWIDEGYGGGAPQRRELLEQTPWLELRMTKLKMPPSVRGVVVDERGAPIAGADVNALNRSVRCKSDGSFTFYAAPDETLGVDELRIEADGFETAILRGPFAWGARDLRAALRGGLDVELLVVDASGGPVEDFAAWIWPDYDGRSRPWVFFPSAQRTRTYGHHDGGTVVLHGLCRGAHRLFVEPRDPWRMATVVRRIELRDPSPVGLRIELPRSAERVVRVVDGRGAAVAGATVELLEQSLGELRADTEAWPIEIMLRTFGPDRKALLRQRTSTDQNGEATLRGPAGARLAVRVPGPVSRPAFAADVDLEAAAPLVLQVRRGAALAVQLRPEGVIAALRGYAGLGAKATPAWEPRLELVWAGAVTGVDDEDGREATPGADGRAVFAGVPPGTWRLQLTTCVRTSLIGMRQLPLVLGTYALHDGDTVSAALELPQLLPGELCGTVTENGAPVAGRLLRLHGVFGTEPDRAARFSEWFTEVTTDVDGRFRATVRPGRYTVVAMNRFRGVADEVVAVGRGDRREQAFTLRTGTLRVRLVDAAGKPVPGVIPVLADLADDAVAHEMDASARAGTFTMSAAADTFALFAQRVEDGDASRVRVSLGTITVLQGTEIAVECALPEDWPRR